MPDGEVNQWPHFEIVKFAEPTGIPYGWDAELVRHGAPKSLLGRYHATATLVLTEHQEYGQLVRFGTTMLTGSMCLDPRTGVVLWVTHNATSPVWLVNASLRQFIASVAAVLDRFPFESLAANEEPNQSGFGVNWNQAVEDLNLRLNQVDSQALQSVNGFWQTFLDDVQMGDFSRDDILGAAK